MLSLCDVTGLTFDLQQFPPVHFHAKMVVFTSACRISELSDQKLCKHKLGRQGEGYSDVQASTEVEKNKKGFYFQALVILAECPLLQTGYMFCRGY